MIRQTAIGVCLTGWLLLGAGNFLFAQPAKSLRDLNAHCPFTPPSDLPTWQSRAEDLKLQLQVSLGLWPRPELDPVQPAIYGRIERDDYTIEKVHFESLPGFYVTGNLYRPKSAAVANHQVPAILCPHGHWQDARFYDLNESQVKQLLASGAERFENAARNHIQARCVQLARMGCIVFHWDMIGYCDSQQIGERAHRFANQPAETEVTDEGWLLFSPLAESHCQSVIGMQALAIERAVDMLLTLPEVDPQRIGITGASGGGTQSFLGAAVDERIACAFPAVMVSTGMQGGCTCENACMLRTGTGNVELAALIAPRPVGLTAADDWTKTMPQDGFPELQKLYGLFNASKKVALFPAVHFGHNFNHVSRVAMYGWFNENFKLGLKTPILERDFEVAFKDELQVWDEQHPAPAGGLEFERKLMKLWAEIIDSRLLGLRHGDAQQQQTLSQVLVGGWRVCLGLTSGVPKTAQVDASAPEAVAFSSESLPSWRLLAGKPQPASDVSADQAKSEAADGKLPHDAIMETWNRSAADLHFTLTGEGEPQKLYPVLAGQRVDEAGKAERVALQALVPNPRLAAAYTFGYNAPLFAQRAQQIGLTLLWLSKGHPGQTIEISGQGADAALAAAGVFVAQQLALADGENSLPNISLAVKPGDFSFANATSIRDPHFLPGSLRYQDLAGLLSCLTNVEAP